jgi:hypothetical protein
MRAFVIWSLTVALAALGAVLDLVWAAATEGPTYPINTLGLGVLGLLLGLLVARLALPAHPRRRIDPARPRRQFDPTRYPNRVIRRR